MSSSGTELRANAKLCFSLLSGNRQRTQRFASRKIEQLVARVLDLARALICQSQGRRATTSHPPAGEGGLTVMVVVVTGHGVLGNLRSACCRAKRVDSA